MNLRPEIFVKCKCGGSIQRLGSAYELLRPDVSEERRPVFLYQCVRCGKKYGRAFMEPSSVPSDEKSYQEWRDSEIAILIEGEDRI